jgi:hypothetical protein
VEVRLTSSLRTRENALIVYIKVSAGPSYFVSPVWLGYNQFRKIL